MTSPTDARDWYFRIDTEHMTLAHGNVRNLTVTAELIRTLVTNMPPLLLPDKNDQLTITITPRRDHDSNDDSTT